MLIAPIIFCTVVTGIAGMEDMKVGRVGVKALVYFEVVTTLALIIGLVVVNPWKPGAGMNVDVAALDAKAIAAYVAGAVTGHRRFSAEHHSDDGRRRLREGRDPPGAVLLGAVRLGALPPANPGGRSSFVHRHVSHALFIVVGFIMRLAPIGAFGAMAFTIGKYGIGSLLSLGKLMAGFYLTCLLFIFVVLAASPAAGFSIWRFIAYIKDEIADRARHLVVGIGAAADDGEAGKARLLEVGRRAGDSDRLLVQSRRHVHLPDDGGDFRRAGDEHAADAGAAARHCSPCCC